MFEILIATDGSKVSEEMVDFAMDFTSALESEAFVVYVSDAPPKEDGSGQDAGRSAIEYAVRKAKERNVPVSSEIIHGIPAVDIVNKANEIGARAIIMGSLGRTGISRFLIGSVAERVIKLAYGPVIIVRKSQRGTGFGLERMLIATDGSEANKSAVRTGLRLASRLKMEVTAVSVNDTREASGTKFSETWALTKDMGKSAVADVVRQGHELGVDVEPLITDGVPHVEISELSADYDLVVIGSLGKSGISQLRVGSVAERVVRHSKCPVMVVRATDSFAPLDPF